MQELKEVQALTWALPDRAKGHVQRRCLQWSQAVCTCTITRRGPFSSCRGGIQAKSHQDLSRNRLTTYAEETSLHKHREKPPPVVEEACAGHLSH
eukprot:1152683-Pelagomonas_calceolata.AAC.4